MTRLNVVLAIVLVVCALGLVTSQHRARRQFIELQHAQNQASQLEVRWDQLQLDQTGLATAALIDAKARRGLAMEQATPKKTLYLSVEQPVDKTAMGTGR